MKKIILILLLAVLFIPASGFSQLMGKRYKKERIKVEVYRISAKKKRESRLNTFSAVDKTRKKNKAAKENTAVAIDNHIKGNKKKAKEKTATADDKWEKNKKNKKDPERIFEARENRTFMSQKTRSGLQSMDFINHRKTIRSSLTRKERKVIESADSTTIIMRKEYKKKSNKTFKKSQNKVVERNLRLQDPQTRKRMKMHQRKKKKKN